MNGGRVRGKNRCNFGVRIAGVPKKSLKAGGQSFGANPQGEPEDGGDAVTDYHSRGITKITKAICMSMSRQEFAKIHCATSQEQSLIVEA
jgi:hypothetical protein